ncbi:DinB family protein [Robiginitalea biformata]|uniref:DinB family protein n=1 Tax=Robiginitalea biformata TaxID=252307 RepID=UPI003B598274
MDWTEDFKENSLFRMDESVRMLAICMEKVPDGLFWHREHGVLNSVGNLMLHLSGNIRQYIISGLGGAPDSRERDMEFEAVQQSGRAEVWAGFQETVREAQAVIRGAQAADLLEKRNVQGFTFSGMGLVIHAVEHLSYHTGQIAFIVKAGTGQQLGFYDGLDLTTKNS